MQQNDSVSQTPSGHPRNAERPSASQGLLKHLNLHVKANLIIISILVSFLIIVIALMQINTNALIFQIGQQRVREEANLLQMQIGHARETILKDARILAMTPGITTNLVWTKAALTSGTAPIFFDNLYVVETLSKLATPQPTSPLSPSIEAQELIGRALLGQEGVAIIPNDAAEPNLCLVAAVPLWDESSDTIIGALVASRQITQAFLRDLSYGGQHVGLGVIYQGELIAGTLHEHPHGLPHDSTIPPGIPPYEHEHDHTATPVAAATDSPASRLYPQVIRHQDLDIAQKILAEQQDGIAQALQGDTVILDQIIEHHDIPHAVAFMPLVTGSKEGNAVLAVLIGLDQLVAFQQEFFHTLAIAFIVLIMIAVGVASFAIRNSITAPIQRLQLVAEQLAKGHYTQRVDLRSTDEVGKLAQAFNSMATTLNSLISSLETRVRERTVELEIAMSEARNARNIAEQANQMKSQFLANMSHELRTPLNSIINFTRIIAAGMRGPVTNEQLDYLNRVRSSGEHLLGIINDILDLSKIEAGRMELYLEQCSLGELVRSTLSTAMGLTKNKPIELVHDIALNLPMVQADRTRIRQVLLNLLSNATKFTDEGRITVSVWQDADKISISVRDTGIGIPADKLDTIFAEFQQADSGSDRSYEGTGLGLAICKRFIEMHGGQIFVESTLNEGATFTFTLPIHQAPPSETPILSYTTTNKNGIPVLVIDDDQAVIDIVASYLEQDGYTVYGITDSRHALHEAHRIKPAVIILDILMPYKDGWELLAECKATPDLQTIPVILYTVVEENKLGLQMGANAYLVKPIEEQLLRKTVSRLVKDGARVLVIDDDPNVLEMVQEMLSQTNNYVIVTANGGQAGLDCIATQHPDLVILDLMMPEVDGFAVLEALEEDATTYTIPVVILTAKDLSPEEQEYLSRRVNSCLAKDVTNAEHLSGKVNALLGQIQE